MRQCAKCIESNPMGNETFETAFLPERDYVTFGSLLSHCRLSVVCNVGAPYSGGLTFRQYFFTAVYLSHHLTYVQNVMEIVPRKPNRRGC